MKLKHIWSGFQGSGIVLANDLWKNYSSVYKYRALFLVQTAPLHNFSIPQCCHPSQLGHFFNACRYGNQTGTLLILTVLADCTHEPWTTNTRPVVFITRASILTNWASFCAVRTPESLQTHWENNLYSHFHHYHVNLCGYLAFSCSKPFLLIKV